MSRARTTSTVHTRARSRARTRPPTRIRVRKSARGEARGRRALSLWNLLGTPIFGHVLKPWHARITRQALLEHAHTRTHSRACRAYAYMHECARPQVHTPVHVHTHTLTRRHARPWARTPTHTYTRPLTGVRTRRPKTTTTSAPKNRAPRDESTATAGHPKIEPKIGRCRSNFDPRFSEHGASGR